MDKDIISKSFNKMDWTIEYIGDGLYRCGCVIFGRKGLEEFDKAIKEKAKEYAINKTEVAG